jgi:hypothetical protein
MIGGPELTTVTSALRTPKGRNTHLMILAVLVAHIAPASMRSDFFGKLERNRPNVVGKLMGLGGRLKPAKITGKTRRA